jgi:asparagine synthase (glutamine-hydrolysing)
MVSASKRFVVTFNGEIYNFTDLRRELTELGHKFRGTSDTEVLLEAVDEWGIVEAVSRFNGMFAFAIWDKKDACLHLARDRMGEKPLYYGTTQRGEFYFASQLASFRATDRFPLEIHRDSLAEYLRLGYVPAPRSIYRDVYKLPQASILTVRVLSSGLRLDKVAYWKLPPAIEVNGSPTSPDQERELSERLHQLALDSVKIRQVSDVPLGAFLSGGVDSSTVVSLMQSTMSKRVRTFTIGFSEAEYDESGPARAVAQHLGTDHTEVCVTPSEAIQLIPQLPTFYDEPFADASQIPTYLVSRLARQYVTVSLSGDGGDELFAGYGRYTIARFLSRKLDLVPLKLRSLIRRSVDAFYPDNWDGALGSLLGWVSPSLRNASARFRLKRVSDLIDSRDALDVYKRLVTHWSDVGSLVIGAGEESNSYLTLEAGVSSQDPIAALTYLDLQTYLPDDILVKLDRASMAVGLEARAPFLDHRLVELCMRIPTALKVKGGISKWLLRELLYKYVPPRLIERPKMGFGVPIDTWLRGPLREWASDLLCSSVMRRQGYLEPRDIQKKWQEHLSGKRNWHSLIWDVLMFQTWLNYNHSEREGLAECRISAG